jgi:hypothetical protein
MHSFVPGLDTPSYSLADVAAAGGITIAQVRRMLAKGVISLGPHDRKGAKGVPGRFTRRRVLSIALAAKARSFGMDRGVTGVIARDFADGGLRDRPWLESPQAPLLILFPETNDFRFGSSASLTIKEILTSSGGLAGAFVVLNCALMIQRVEQRLAQCVATRVSRIQHDKPSSTARQRSSARSK